jgi:hypothetical protein
MKTSVYVPAISRELKFSSENWDELCQVVEGKIGDDPSLRSLATLVRDRADEAHEWLLREISEHLRRTNFEGFRITNWRFTSDRWSMWSEVFRGNRGPKRRVGIAGITIGYGAEKFRFVGYARLSRGGQDARRKVRQKCESKELTHIHLTEDQPTRYPDWDPAIVWLDRPLTLKMSVKELQTDAAIAAKQLMKVSAEFFR